MRAVVRGAVRLSGMWSVADWAVVWIVVRFAGVWIVVVGVVGLWRSSARG